VTNGDRSGDSHETAQLAFGTRAMESQQRVELNAPSLAEKTPSTRSRVFLFLAVMLAINLVEVYFLRTRLQHAELSIR
jgi:hypothetical protein